jgi:phenylacetate-CoA ligase
MMEHFDRFNTRGLKREEAMALALQAETSRDFQPTLQGYTVGLSSGTSGHRGLFVASPEEQAAWAGTILARAIHRLRPISVAFFLRSNSNLYEQVDGRLVRFRYFDLMTPIEEACAALSRMQPDVLVAPASLLGIFARQRRDGRLAIAPERLISVAEVLEPQEHERIARAFAAPVHQIYQCTEGLLAVSCVQGALHVQEDIVALQYEPLPGPGERVTPIVTDLWRRTQPIIRYRLDDVLRLDPDPCPCGSDWQVIAAIEGRCDDICIFETLAGEQRPVFADTIRRILLLASPDIEDYQAEQRTPGELNIALQLIPGANFDEIATAVRLHVVNTLSEYGCRIDALSVVEGLPQAQPGAKRRRVTRVRDGEQSTRPESWYSDVRS